MSKETEELLKALKEHCKTSDSIFPAVVKEVREGEDTIDIEMDGLELGDVRLRSVIDAEGSRVVVYPTIGSVVLVGRIGQSNELFVSSCSLIDKVMVQIGDMKLVADESGFVFNDGEHTSAFADVLKTELGKLSKRVDDIISALKSAPPDSNAGTFKAGLVPLLNGIVNKESFNAIEDTKIKH